MQAGDFVKLKSDFTTAIAYLPEGTFALKPNSSLDDLKGKTVKIVEFNIFTLNPIVEFNNEKYEIDESWIES